MSIEEKYNIRYFNNKRYYKCDLSETLPLLQDTNPYYFEYKNYKIYETAWKRLTVKILEMLDEINPIPEEKLLELEYSWSNTQVFSAKKRVNYSPFKNIYVNTNHTATHAGMNIRFLLLTYGVDPGECILYIRRHPAAEPPEARDYYRKQTEDSFRKCLEFQGISDNSIDVIINNFKVINKFLAHGSTGFNDFFLFDDYWYYCNYKQKTLEYVDSRYYGTKNQRVTVRALDLLDGYYKHRDFYLKFLNVDVPDDFEDIVSGEIDTLIKNLHSPTISASKLYARIVLLHSELLNALGELNNVNDFYTLTEILLSDEYIFKKPFISNDSEAKLENDDILMSYAFSLDEFNSETIKNYIKKMHLKQINNYSEFIDNCSEYFVQVDADRMVNKDLLDIKSEMLEKIKKELKYYINSFGKIDTLTYADYDSLPSLGYPWNKYLLVGVIRTFLRDDFTYESKGGMFKNADFIINIK